MANHFSSIGLKVSGEQDFLNYLKLACNNGEEIKTDFGTYIKWHIGNGIELWGQIDKNNCAIGMNPHFSGKSKIKVRTEKIIKRDKDTDLDGALYCWAQPEENEGKGIYPLVFDLPDMAVYGDLSISKIVNAQITGFAHEISAYQNADEFYNSQEGEPKFASESFVPAGLFSADGKASDPPQSIAIINGHVIETQKLRNPYTQLEFIYARINTLGGEFDIVADPEILSGEICIDGIVSGTFWLSGRIVNDCLENESKPFKFSLLRFLGRK